MQLLFRDIAEWLHPSDFYQLLLQLSHDAEEDDLINIPYYEISPVIQPGEEEPLKRVLQTCRYWGLELKDWPDEICEVLWGYGNCIEMKEIVHQLYPTMYIGYDIHSIVIDGNLRALQYQHEHDGLYWNVNTCMYAAYRGHLDCLQYLHERGCNWNEETCSRSAYSGQLECLQYAHEHGCPWNGWTCSDAAGNGQLECLQYAHEHGCPWNDSTCSGAAGNGQLECLKYAHEHGCHWDHRTCRYAACNGHLECLQYAHENGCPWNEATCTNAAGKGHLECLQYAHEHGCLIDLKECMRKARRHKRKHIIHYLLKYQPQSKFKCVIN